MIFLDSNVVIDLLEDQQWTDWSQRAVGAFDDAPIVSNFVVVAEVAPAFRTSSEVLVFLEAIGVRLKPIDAEAAFRAGKAHAAYRASAERARPSWPIS
jgi:predicted nucleic acid-binding protein